MHLKRRYAIAYLLFFTHKRTVREADPYDVDLKFLFVYDLRDDVGIVPYDIGYNMCIANNLYVACAAPHKFNPSL